MLSLILNFLICSIILLKIEDFKNNIESIYSLTAISLLVAFAINGLFGISFVFFKITYLPLLVFSTLIFFLMMLNNFLRKNFIFLKHAYKKEFSEILATCKENYLIKLVVFFLLIYFLVALGPINSSDAANAYVGYPYKFWLKNAHFIDGDLNQGLLGLGDFSNLFYFQDKTTWLIRFTQFIPLLILLPLILKRKTNQILLFVIFTSPVLIQWMSIGKNNFLSEASLVVIFLVWEKYKCKRDLIYLISASLISISFKISALLICIPIFIFLINFYKHEILKINFRDFYKFIFTFPLLVSILSLLTIFSYRFYLYENPFYPLLTSIFNSSDKQLLDWENTLRNWDRSRFFQFWIFFPKSIGKISFVLGPANFFIFLGSVLFIIDRRSKITNNTIIGISQFILLLLFAQGRADYYVSPIFLTYVGISNLEFTLTKNILFKTLFKFSLIAQFLMFSAASIYLIYTNALVLINYDKGMDRIGWNYYNSKIISEKAIDPVFSESTGMTHLYFKDDFISNNSFQNCYYYNENNKINNKYFYCVKKLGINTIIVDKNKLSEDNNFTCKTEQLKRVSRNIFLTRKKEVDFCYLK